MTEKKYCVGYMDTRPEFGVWKEIVVLSEKSKTSRTDPPNVRPRLFALDEAKRELKELRKQGQNGFLFEIIHPKYLD